MRWEEYLICCEGENSCREDWVTSTLAFAHGRTVEEIQRWKRRGARDAIRRVSEGLKINSARAIRYRSSQLGPFDLLILSRQWNSL